MKRVILTLSMGLALFAANGQQTQGRVVYQRTLQMRLRMPGDDDLEPMMPRSHTDKLEVLFSTGQSLRRPLDDEEVQDEMSAQSGGMKVNLMIDGTNDLTYTNFSAGQIIDQREFGARNYIVTDSIHKQNWKLTGESRTILGYPCQQATSQLVVKRMAPVMDNGDFKKKETTDTMNVTAWFTLAVPVPAGPEYQGQLPGLILAIDVDNGRVVYEAVELSQHVDVADIKAPSKGKKVSQEEFVKERDKVMKEIQKNKPRGATIRIGG